MTTPFEQVNWLPILEVLDKLGIWYAKNWNWYCLLHDDWSKDESFSIDINRNIVTDFGKTGIKGWVFDFIWQYCLWFDSDFMKTDEGRKATLEFCAEHRLISLDDNKKEFVKSLTSQELLERFEEFKLNWYKKEISKFLMTRGVPYDYISKHANEIGAIFKDIWYYDNYFCTEFETYKDADWQWVVKEGDEPKNVWVFMFPCYDKDWTLVGMKLRRIDGKTIRWKKSIAVWKTGLLYEWKISWNTVVLVEWEMDYIILRILGYRAWTVIGNLGWVQSHRLALKSLLYSTSKIICLYDNDRAGEKGKQDLMKTLDRPIYEIEFPIREDLKWNRITDVNDLYKSWYDTKKKWDKLFQEAKRVELPWEDPIDKDKYPFVFLRSTLEYYDTEFKKIQKTNDVAAYLWLTGKELFRLVQDWIIKQYIDLCYWYGWKPWYYNTLDESKLILDWWEEEPELHPYIHTLIRNISWEKKKNYDWIMQSILYKITHINDVTIPALVLYWFGWSGKWTFLELLSAIFSSENTLIWLWQKDLESSFDSYQWNKLIVEFKEVSSWNKFNDKKTLDRIKSFVWEPRITVNPKYGKVREVDNIARFHLSSNHSVPIQLDSKYSWNRRFTIIKTANKKLPANIASELWNNILKDKKIIKQFIAWLYDTYPDVPRMNSFLALENAEKRMLEQNTESAANLFFEWFEKKFPNIRKLTVKEKNMLLTLYAKETGEDIYDAKYKQSNFDLWLSHKYEKKTIKIRWKTSRWYYIHKTDTQKDYIPESATWYFKEWEVERMEWIVF